MTVKDAKSLDRTAQRVIVEARKAYGSPPVYDKHWLPVWGAKVDRIAINGGSRPSVVTIWFPELRWHETFELYWGDMIRIRTDERMPVDQTIVFSGFVTSSILTLSVM